MTQILTDHGEIRLRGRLGFPKPAVPRMAAKPLVEGRHREDFRGELRKYLDNVFISHGGAADNMRLLGETLYLFADAVLITAWQLPRGLRPLARI
jgi:hypothetical protein